MCPARPFTSSTRKHGRGFTLAELLVVAGIIIVLIAILLPVLSKVRERARRAQCSSNMRQIGSALFAYAADNKGQLFVHWRSVANPARPYWNRLSTKTNGTPWGPMNAFIPPEQRSSHPMAASNQDPPPADQPALRKDWEESKLSQADGQKWASPPGAWSHLGGRNGPILGLYPKYMSNGKAWVCPSIFSHAWQNYEAARSAQDFSEVERYVKGGAASWSFWSPYIGNLYGRIDSPREKYGNHNYWDAYYIRGYNDFGDARARSPKGALMWEVGSYWFVFGIYYTYTPPYAGEGAHKVGGNVLMVDGSVNWWQYDFPKEENNLGGGTPF
jgi:prepilin-type processing-associated H-X9-DG protein